MKLRVMIKLQFTTGMNLQQTKITPKENAVIRIKVSAACGFLSKKEKVIALLYLMVVQSSRDSFRRKKLIFPSKSRVSTDYHGEINFGVLSGLPSSFYHTLLPSVNIGKANTRVWISSKNSLHAA